MISAGRLDRKIEFYAVVVSEDALGVERESFVAVAPAMASVKYGTGNERREAGQAGSHQAATFRVQSTAALRAMDQRGQIEFEGARWGITSVVQVGILQREIEFTAVKKGA